MRRYQRRRSRLSKVLLAVLAISAFVVLARPNDALAVAPLEVRQMVQGTKACLRNSAHLSHGLLSCWTQR